MFLFSDGLSPMSLKRIQKLEKLDYRSRKAELDLQFLYKCDDSNVILDFLNFLLEKIVILNIQLPTGFVN